ncbi:unnamed protein product [Sphenostylis stenocarpa]|uniref:Uncharacterized protein n=1 Tax=Sphenostylis stenocarpa TaxID=92480 RepID=A0AA86V5R4_9FABA|nr:unnamed protein product [Sphenostylis stenocarpa]
MRGLRISLYVCSLRRRQRRNCSGKSSTVYACAKEQGFSILELNSSHSRNGTAIRNLEEPLTSIGFHRLQEAIYLKLEIQEYSNVIIQWLTQPNLPVGGIAGQSDRGAQSVVLSGGYVDDEDHGEWFLYTGSGDKDLSGNKRTNKSHSFDQKFEKYNRALHVSCLQGYPVRVVRSQKEKRSSYAPEIGVRYDGIYRIEKCWQIAGLQGFKVCRYLFVSDDVGDRPRALPVIRELKKATVIYERTESASWDYDAKDCRWKWMKPPPPSSKKVQIEEPVEVTRAKTDSDIRKFQLNSIKEQLHKGFSCMICKEVMVSPVTTPYAHNFCKSCLEGEFAGQAFVKERSRGGRTLRSQKNVMKCPSCPIDISDYLQNIQVDIDLKSAIESLKAKVEEIEESLESSEDAADGFQDNGVGKDDDTDSGNQNSVEQLNDLPEGSDVDELKDTNTKGQD